MDKQGRLTKLDEWIIGERYQWLKWLKGRHGAYFGPIKKCVEINKNDNSIRFENDEGEDMFKCFNWQRRYTPSPREIPQDQTTQEDPKTKPPRP